MIDCSQIRERLLTEPVAAFGELESHLSRCEPCRDAADRILEAELLLAAELDDFVAHGDLDGAWAELDVARPHTSRAMGALVAAAAVAVLLLVPGLGTVGLISSWWARDTPTDPATSASPAAPSVVEAAPPPVDEVPPDKTEAGQTDALRPVREEIVRQPEARREAPPAPQARQAPAVRERPLRPRPEAPPVGPAGAAPAETVRSLVFLEPLSVAEVWVDGQRRGGLTMMVELPQGAHQIEVRCGSATVFRGTVEITTPTTSSVQLLKLHELPGRLMSDAEMQDACG